jgi:predicted amidohydrolase
MKTQVAVVQTDPKLGDLAGNLGHIEAGIAAAKAKLVVFPECATSGYGFDSKLDGLEFAEPIPGPATMFLTRACKRARCFAVVGMLEKAGKQLFNSAAVIGPAGVVGVYRKMHRPFLGVDRFTAPGNLGFPVFKLPFGRIGVLICYDLSFPEAARILKLKGAQTICVPTNWPLAADVSCHHSPMVRAQENHVNVITADRAGTEAGFTFLGGSKIVHCGGVPIAEAGRGREIIRASLDFAAADRNRVVFEKGRYEIDRISHRRPRDYQELVRG